MPTYRKVHFVIVVVSKRKKSKLVRINVYNPQKGYDLIENLIRKGYTYAVEVPRKK